VRGPALAVALEQRRGVIVAPVAIRRVGELERDGPADHARGRRFAADIAHRDTAGGGGRHNTLTGPGLVGGSITARGERVAGDHGAHDPGHEDDRELERPVGLVDRKLVRHGLLLEQGFARRRRQTARQALSACFSMSYWAAVLSRTRHSAGFVSFWTPRRFMTLSRLAWSDRPSSFAVFVTCQSLRSRA